MRSRVSSRVLLSAAKPDVASGPRRLASGLPAGVRAGADSQAKFAIGTGSSNRRQGKRGLPDMKQDRYMALSWAYDALIRGQVMLQRLTGKPLSLGQIARRANVIVHGAKIRMLGVY